MKKLITLLVLTIATIVSANAQEYRLYKTQNYHNQLRLNTRTGRVEQIQDDGQSWQVVFDLEPQEEYTNRFRLYETQNIWTFIELDTFTGRLWQVQFSVEGAEYRTFFTINQKYLAVPENKSIFTIQPLTSMFQYYLMNEYTGEMWKFQWSTKGDDYRWIEKM
ncbi:MAG: hypothetical protein K6A94_13835 [Bacteroidales bacterium]|nr:hypothetical protein [Bacteroidales bacterium]